MNATVNGRPVTPRSGYSVEFNTLWYNALMYVSELLAENEGASELSSRLAGIAGKTANSFVDTLLNEGG